MATDQLDPLDRLDRLARAVGYRIGLRIMSYPGDPHRSSQLGVLELRDHDPGIAWKRRELRHAEALIGGGSFTRHVDRAAEALIVRVRRDAGMS
jgi:hypothetical protein